MILNTPLLITPAKCRAARAALGWSQKRLAVAANMSVGPITRYELYGANLLRNNLMALQRALEDAGITFHGSGIEWFEPEVDTEAPKDLSGDGTPAKPYTLNPALSSGDGLPVDQWNYKEDH